MSDKIEEMVDQIEEAVETEFPEDFTQGQVLGATAAQSALEHTVSSYLMGVGAVLGTLAQAARNLAEDGLGLLDFAELLEGNDLDYEEEDDDDEEEEEED